MLHRSVIIKAGTLQPPSPSSPLPRFFPYNNSPFAAALPLNFFGDFSKSPDSGRTLHRSVIIKVGTLQPPSPIPSPPFPLSRFFPYNNSPFAAALPLNFFGGFSKSPDSGWTTHLSSTKLERKRYGWQNKRISFRMSKCHFNPQHNHIPFPG